MWGIPHLFCYVTAKHSLLVAMFCQKAVFSPAVHLLSIKDGKRCQIQDGALASSDICALLPFIQITINLLETDKVISRQTFFTVVVVTIPHNFLLRDKITRNADV